MSGPSKAERLSEARVALEEAKRAWLEVDRVYNDAERKLRIIEQEPDP